MFILPYLFSPLAFSIATHRSTHYKFNVQDPTDSATIYPKESRLYKDAIEKIPGHKIKNELSGFFSQQKIRNDVIVNERYHTGSSLTYSGFCIARGTNYSENGDAAIYVLPKLHSTDKEACHWAVKYQAYHIKNNDLFNAPLISAITTVATATFLAFTTIHLIPAILLTGLIGFVANRIFTEHRQAKTEDMAVANSSIEELKGGLRYLRGQEAMGKEVSDLKITHNLRFTSWATAFKPTNTKRLQKKITDALKKQSVVLNEVEEKKKTIVLKNLMFDTFKRRLPNINKNFKEELRYNRCTYKATLI
jgi:hypothetical protein